MTLPAAAPVASARRSHPGVLGAVVIVVGTFGLWLFAACAELFWYDQHGSRFVIVALASLPASAALLWIMARRLRPADQLSPWLLVLAAVAGGFVALIIPSLVEPPWTKWLTEIGARSLAPTIAGPLEEAVKLVVVLIVARWVTVRTARTGLFVGGAVGAGYAVFENIDYAWKATGRMALDLTPSEHLGVMMRVAIERDVFTAFAHPLWTALVAAALFAGSRGGRLRMTRLAVAGWAVAVVLHSLWDDVLRLLPPFVGGSAVLGLALQLGWVSLIAIIGFVIWRIVASRANRGAVQVEKVNLPAA